MPIAALQVEAGEHGVADGLVFLVSHKELQFREVVLLGPDFLYQTADQFTLGGVLGLGENLLH